MFIDALINITRWSLLLRLTIKLKGVLIIVRRNLNISILDRNGDNAGRIACTSLAKSNFLHFLFSGLGLLMACHSYWRGMWFGSGSSLLGWLLWIGSVSATEKLAFGCSHCCGAGLQTFGGAGAQSIKGAHGARLLIGLCSLLICVSKWMLLYWYSSKCHDAGLKKKHRTEKTISSLNVKDIFLHLNYSGMILLLLFLLLLLLLCLQGMVVLLL